MTITAEEFLEMNKIDILKKLRLFVTKNITIILTGTVGRLKIFFGRNGK
jgi:hypothetical protein